VGLWLATARFAEDLRQASLFAEAPRSPAVRRLKLILSEKPQRGSFFITTTHEIEN
jgi:hypothetical protein